MGSFAPSSCREARGGVGVAYEVAAFARQRVVRLWVPSLAARGKVRSHSRPSPGARPAGRALHLREAQLRPSRDGSARRLKIAITIVLRQRFDVVQCLLLLLLCTTPTTVRYIRKRERSLGGRQGGWEAGVLPVSTG
jgi:hypothetical protein